MVTGHRMTFQLTIHKSIKNHREKYSFCFKKNNFSITGVPWILVQIYRTESLSVIDLELRIMETVDSD